MRLHGFTDWCTQLLFAQKNKFSYNDVYLLTDAQKVVAVMVGLVTAKHWTNHTTLMALSLLMRKQDILI